MEEAAFAPCTGPLHKNTFLLLCQLRPVPASKHLDDLLNGLTMVLGSCVDECSRLPLQSLTMVPHVCVSGTICRSLPGRCQRSWLRLRRHNTIQHGRPPLCKCLVQVHQDSLAAPRRLWSPTPLHQDLGQGLHVRPGCGPQATRQKPKDMLHARTPCALLLWRGRH